MTLQMTPRMIKRVLVLIGTRPEAIKMAPLIAALRREADLQTLVVSTGQHREMLAQVVDLFGLRVDHDLAVMRPGQTLAGLTASLVEKFDALLTELRPDLALVQGDTTTSFAGALNCFYRAVPVAHVEAGLRTGNLASPFPEEANRRLTTVLAALHFPPTERARQNLLREGVPAERIVVTGNTVIDALAMEVRRQRDPAVGAGLTAQLRGVLGPEWPERPYVLVTGHRRENIGQGFEQICRALGQLAGDFPQVLFVYPVHLNPAIREVVYRRLAGRANIRLIAPQDYDTFVALLTHCRLVLSDSGGVQEEAPTLGKPVLVMRDTTERPEGLEAGTVRLVGTDERRIVAEVAGLLTDAAAYRRMAEAKNPYGDGHAAERIVERVRQFLFGERIRSEPLGSEPLGHVGRKTEPGFVAPALRLHPE